MSFLWFFLRIPIQEAVSTTLRQYLMNISYARDRALTRGLDDYGDDATTVSLPIL